MEDDPLWKMTSKIKTWNISATIGPFSMTKLNVIETLNEDDLSWKMTPCGRRPQKLKLGISQQSLVRSYSNLKCRLIGPNQMLRETLNEDDL